LQHYRIEAYGFFIPDVKKPVDRCACVEAVTRSMLLNCIILPFSHLLMYTIGFAMQVGKCKALFFFFFISHCFLKLMWGHNTRVRAVLLGTFGCIILGGALQVSHRTQ